MTFQATPAPNPRPLWQKSPVRFLKRIRMMLIRMLIRNHHRIRWMIPDRYFLFSVPGGKMFLRPKESFMMLQRIFGLYETQKMAAVQQLLKPGGTFIDVGGNKGDFSLLAAKVVGDSGKVICIEPEHTNAGWIHSSLGMNRYRNITICELALSDQNGDAVLHLGTKSGLHTLRDSALERELGSVIVKTRTLDSLLQEKGIRHVDVIKIDVEGAELQVLRGALQTIAENPGIVLLIDIHPGLGVNPAEVVACLNSAGLRAYRMEAPFERAATPTTTLDEVLARRAA